MSFWPSHPVISEINPWVWLEDPSRKYEGPDTPSGAPIEEWETLASGSGVPWAMPLRTRTRGVGKTSGGPCPIPGLRTTGGPHGVRRHGVAGLLWAARRDCRPPAESPAGGGASASAISFPTAWPPIIPGSWITPNPLFRGRPTIPRAIRRPRCGVRQGFCLGCGALLPGLSECAPAQRF